MAKIKSKSEPWNIYHNGNEVEEYLKEHILSDEHVIDDDNEIYVRRSDGHVYPLSHPDLSTQPSILHERFGTYRIYEVLIPGIVNGHARTLLSYDLIPATAVIMSVFAFDDERQSAVNTKRVVNGWEFSVVGGFVPDFLLVKYYDTERDTYYGSGEDYGDGQYENDDETDEAYWRYYEPHNEQYLVNSKGKILIFVINDSQYVIKKKGYYVEVVEVSSLHTYLIGVWGNENISITGVSYHFSFTLAPDVRYECYNNGPINPEPSSFIEP